MSATGEFIKGISAVTTSILWGTSAEQIAAMQMKTEQALVKAEALHDLISVAIDSSAETVFASAELDERKLDEVASQMRAEAAVDERSDYDQRIAHDFKQIEEQMSKEL